MSLLEFIQLILRNKRWVLYFPLLVAIAVFFLTRNTPKTYSTELVIYTGIASGFNPDNAFDNKIDFHAVNSRFDNLINIIGSGETRKDVAVCLLSFELNNPICMQEMLDHCKNESLSKSLNAAFVSKYKKSDELSTSEFLEAELAKGQGTDIYELIFGDKKNPFNIKTLAEVKSDRIGFSDMLKIEYTCEDPLLCKKTLDLMKDVFLKKYKAMRIGEADQSVKYFREQTSASKHRLEIAENNLKGFRSNNGVINYYEQTKYIADQKEDMEKSHSSLQMEISGYKTALTQIEAKINARYLIQLQSEKVVQLRNDLAAELNKKGIDVVKNLTNPGSTGGVEELKKSLKDGVDRLYTLNNTTEGLPGKSILEEWLKLTIAKDEAESKLAVLQVNQTDFEKVFDRYAPMGSELSKLEREVETAEKEYLSLLHNLNQAIMRESNLEASENISVIDEAKMPFVPNPAKRSMLIIAGALSSVIFSIIILIIRQYLDSSLASPLRMEKIIGIKTATAFIDQKIYPKANHIMNRRSFERWQMAISSVINSDKPKQSILLVPFNTRLADTSYLLSEMRDWMTEKGTPFRTCTAAEFTKDPHQKSLLLTDQIYLEQQSKAVLDHTALVILFFDANEKLDEYQMEAVQDWKNSNIEIKGALMNGVEHNLSKYLGEIPRHKSKIRIQIKQLFQRYAS